ncbi:hypothetical protein ABIC28_005162 [Rhodococcus sp. PvR044]|uniref:hypothetical protein n=1 Tax=Rhodococcus sp. PvR044 TaxID=3156402 RepID=UPI003395ED0B
MSTAISENDTSPIPPAATGAAPRASAHDHTHPCGHTSSWGRCALHDPVDKLASLWGVAEVVPAAAGTAEHLHPFQYCEAEHAAVDIWAHHSSGKTMRTRTAVVVIRRERPGDRWEATL